MQRTTYSDANIQQTTYSDATSRKPVLRGGDALSFTVQQYSEYSAPDTDSAGYTQDDLLSAIREVRVREEPRLAEVRALPFNFTRAQAPARAASHKTTKRQTHYCPLHCCAAALLQGAARRGYRVSIFVAISCALVTWMPATT